MTVIFTKAQVRKFAEIYREGLLKLDVNLSRAVSLPLR